MEAGRHPGHWLQLPSNLWATIFSYFMPVSPVSRLKRISGQFQLFQLHLVCQTFNKLFQQFDQLNSQIYISHQPQDHNLPSLVEWLRRHQAHVKRLEILHGSPWLESVLVALQSPQSCLEKVVVGGATVPSTAMYLLSTFHCIKHCTIRPYQKENVDLQPLSALTHLETLSLERGCFSSLEAAAHLTSLSLYEAEVICTRDCSCVTSLVSLSLCKARLLRFHSRNFAACLNLQSLKLHQSCIDWGVKEDFNCLVEDEARIPSSLSALTALTRLHLAYPTLLVLDWVVSFSALQSLSVLANAVEFPHLWNNMTSLTSMVVDIYYEHWSDSQPNVDFAFDWCQLSSLSRLELNWVNLRDADMSGLATLPNLQDIVFKHVSPLDVKSASKIAMLAFKLGQRKRSVRFDMHSAD